MSEPTTPHVPQVPLPSVPASLVGEPSAANYTAATLTDRPTTGTPVMPKVEVDPDRALHDSVLAAVEERLLTHPATKDMLGGRAGTDPATDGPAVTLSRGRLSPKPKDRQGPKQTRQADVRVRMSAPHKEQLPALCVAVQTALLSVAGYGPVRQCVLLHTGKFEEEDGRHQRADAVACFV